MENAYPYYASWPGAMINTHSLKLPPSRTYFHGSKGVLAIDALLHDGSGCPKTFWKSGIPGHAKVI